MFARIADWGGLERQVYFAWVREPQVVRLGNVCTISHLWEAFICRCTVVKLKLTQPIGQRSWVVGLVV